MSVGWIRPFLAEAKDVSGNAEKVVIKTNKGYEDTSDSLSPRHIEAFCLLLARGLGLKTVEPVVVDIPPGLEYGAADYNEYKNDRGVKANYPELISASHGLNFATIYADAGWKAIPHGSKFRTLASKEQARDFFTLDALAQNTDRKSDNPNLLMRDRELCLLDFDQAFGMGYFTGKPYPWSTPLQRMNHYEHCLYPSFSPIKKTGLFNESLLERVQNSNLDQICKDAASEILAHFPEADLDMEKLLGYLGKLSHNPNHFFQTLTQLLRA